MGTVVSLREGEQIKLDGAGNGTVKLGPKSHRETWLSPTVSVKTAVAVTVGTCQARVFVGTDASDTNYRDGTFSGDTGDTTTLADDIRLPNAIIVTFAGGVPNDTASVTVSGTKELL